MNDTSSTLTDLAIERAFVAVQSRRKGLIHLQRHRPDSDTLNVAADNNAWRFLAQPQNHAAKRTMRRLGRMAPSDPERAWQCLCGLIDQGDVAVLPQE